MNEADIPPSNNLQSNPSATQPAPLSAEKANTAAAVNHERAVEVDRAAAAREDPWSIRWLHGQAGIMDIFRPREPAKTAALREMSLEELLALLHEERRHRARINIADVSAAIIASIIAFALSLLFHMNPIIAPVAGIVVLLSHTLLSERQVAATMLLARFDDVRVIGPLAEALEYKDSFIRPIAARTLIPLLPKMKASDASLLSPAQRACLNRALEGTNRALILAILKAWEQVGTEGEIEIVQNLSYGRMNAGEYPEVARAARECLPYLRESAQRHRVGVDLLRAADDNQASSETLLRPTLPGGSNEPEEQLLRPRQDG